MVSIYWSASGRIPNAVRCTFGEQFRKFAHLLITARGGCAAANFPWGNGGGTDRLVAMKRETDIFVSVAAWSASPRPSPWRVAD